jgi:hypothetical protein
MAPPNDALPESWVGKAVTFKNDAEHHACWHHRVGLRAVVVLRLCRSLDQKADMLRAEGVDLPAGLAEAADALRLWVRAEPCPSFPRGCEAAIEPDCVERM